MMQAHSWKLWFQNVLARLFRQAPPENHAVRPSEDLQRLRKEQDDILLRLHILTLDQETRTRSAVKE